MPTFHQPRACLFNTIGEILAIPDILFVAEDKICNIIVFGSRDQCNDTNKTLLNATIRYIRATKRFEKIEAYQQC